MVSCLRLSKVEGDAGGVMIIFIVVDEEDAKEGEATRVATSLTFVSVTSMFMADEDDEEARGNADSRWGVMVVILILNSATVEADGAISISGTDFTNDGDR